MNPNEVDMSPHAVTLRLRELSQLWLMWKGLRNARILGPVDDSDDDDHDDDHAPAEEPAVAGKAAK